MAEYVADCPRCGVKNVTFVTTADHSSRSGSTEAIIEAFSMCRACSKTSIGVFRIQNNGNVSAQVGNSGALSGHPNRVYDYYKFQGFITIAANKTVTPPDHLPDAVLNCFTEGAAAFSIGCYNASAAMFRLSLDIASKERLPNKSAEEGGPNRAQRTRLFDRFEYLFENEHLPRDLRELADCLREDGNDGAHDGTLKRADAEDLIDFAQAFLARVYTEPERLRLARERRDARRAG